MFGLHVLSLSAEGGPRSSSSSSSSGGGGGGGGGGRGGVGHESRRRRDGGREGGLKAGASSLSYFHDFLRMRERTRKEGREFVRSLQSTLHAVIAVSSSNLHLFCAGRQAGRQAGKVQSEGGGHATTSLAIHCKRPVCVLWSGRRRRRRRRAPPPPSSLPNSLLGQKIAGVAKKMASEG